MKAGQCKHESMDTDDSHEHGKMIECIIVTIDYTSHNISFTTLT